MSKLTPTQERIVKQLHVAFNLDTIPDAIVAVDAHYTIIYWNPMAERLYGWKKAEVLGRPESEVLKTRPLASTIEQYRRTLRTQRKWIGEFVQQRRDGARIFVSSAVTTMRNSHGSVVGTVAINRDITEHKHIEYNLRFLSVAAKTLSSTLDYETTLDRVAQLAVPRIADWCSIELLDENGKLEQVALAHRDTKKIKWAKALRRRSPPDLAGENGVADVLRTGRPLFMPFLPDNVLANVAKNPKQFALIRKIGLTSIIIVPITYNDKPIGVITFVSAESQRHYTETDLQTAEKLASRASLAIQNAKHYSDASREINERRQTQERLRDSERKLDIILQSVEDGITMIDADGNVVYANDIAAQATGFMSAATMVSASRSANRKEFIKTLGKFDLKDEAGNPIFFADLPGRQIISKKTTKDYVEKIIQFVNKKTGESRWSLIKARAVYDHAGHIEYVVNIIRDITDREELENRKDNFISMASHELKTPITTLKIYTDLLTRQLADHADTRFTGTLSMMTSQINKLNTLIADLLNISKIQAGKLEFRMQNFNIDDLVRNVVDQIKPTTHHAIKIFGLSHKEVYGDPERISQVLINLLTNAVKYSPNSSKINVRISRGRGSVIVSIRDFGIGIEKQYRGKIFERFYQISSQEKTFPGLGMGLYISQEIINKHGGKLWVESQKDKGSVFSFSLPLKPKNHER